MESELPNDAMSGDITTDLDGITYFGRYIIADGSVLVVTGYGSGRMAIGVRPPDHMAFVVIEGLLRSIITKGLKDSPSKD